MSSNNEKKTVGLPMALFTFVVVAVIMSVGLAILKINTMVTFILALFAVCVIAVCTGMSLEKLQDIILTGFKKFALIGMILISVGMVVGSWMISGIVPSIIYYGLKVFTPASFLAIGFIVCCIVSFFTGSSYAALGTIGVAFMAIGYGMDIKPGLVAGMAVSGAIFGDKMSPFSDTTNMAPAAAGTGVFEHIKSMLWTITLPFILSTILYFIMGIKHDAASAESLQSITDIMGALDETFHISIFLLIVPVFTIVLVAKKVPAMISLMIGAFAGVIAALITQPQFTFNEVVTSMSTGFNGEFENEAAAKLLNRGGISGMMSTIVYCIFTLELGLATVMLTTSQYMAILLPGEVFQNAYKKAGIAPYVLSRTLEDGGTIFSFLVPWSAAAIYTAGVLGVPTLSYLPYAFLPIICPICSVICAITGIGVFDTGGKSLRGKMLMKKAE